jgi:MFS transporter, ACS family, hexuronate transporter
VALAAAAHQGWSANLFTTVSDTFPRRAVASVVGIGGFLGAVGGIAFQAATGYFLEWSGNDYAVIFAVCGGAYLTALAIMHLMVPRLREVDLR